MAAVLVCDEASNKLNERLKVLLEGYGAKEVRALGHRQSYAFVCALHRGLDGQVADDACLEVRKEDVSNEAKVPLLSSLFFESICLLLHWSDSIDTNSAVGLQTVLLTRIVTPLVPRTRILIHACLFRESLMH